MWKSVLIIVAVALALGYAGVKAVDNVKHAFGVSAAKVQA